MQIKHSDKMCSPSRIAPWPIIGAHDVTLGKRDLAMIDQFCAELMHDNKALRSPWFAQLGVRAGCREGPCVYIEDHRPISRMSDAAATRFEYRMLGLAGAGDGVLVSTPRDPSFEAYTSRVVGHSAPQIWRAAPEKLNKRQRLATNALNQPDVFAALLQMTKKGKGLTLVPYISSGDVWVLASALAKASSQPVHVAGPPPTLSSFANDKIWFTEMVSRLIGTQSVPLTRDVYSLSDLARTVRELAARSERLVFKLPASAGGLGNISLDAAPLRGLSLSQILTIIRSQLEQIGWRTGDRLLVGRWDANVRASPSVQIWVPSQAQGAPIIEGLFLQKVKGHEGAFFGAERAELDADVTRDLSYQAMQIAVLLQKLGYFGRLSLDAVLLAGAGGASTLHWIEANARWGGVSIPMTLSHKLSAGQSPPQIAITQHHIDPVDLVSMSMLEARLAAAKKARGFAQTETAFFLVPPRTGLALIVGLAKTTERAEELTKIAYSACRVAD